jgi:hypothetical protein
MSQRALLSTLAAAVLALSATSLWAQTTVKVEDAWGARHRGPAKSHWRVHAPHA